MTGLDLTKFAAARLWASTRFPYFATGLFAMVPTPATGLGTMAVDVYWRVYVDPEVLKAWSVPQIGATLVHELGHLLREHAGRAADLGIVDATADAWNIACDAEINDDLLAEGAPLPERPVTPEAFGWPAGELAESYFARIPRGASGGVGFRPGKGRRGASVSQFGPTAGCGSGADGRARPWDLGGGGDGALGEAEAASVRRSVAQALSDAAHDAAGTLPAGWRRWAEGVLQPRVDWRRLLAAEVRRGFGRAPGCSDYSFTRRSRRASACPGLVLPGMFQPVPSAAIVVDTSASMGAHEIALALAEVEGVLRACAPAARALPVLACDSSVRARSRARRASDVALRGGGGTDMGAGIRAASRLRPRPQVVVVLTDGFTPWPSSPPRQVAVVVGLVGTHASEACVPRWARTVAITGGGAT